MGRVPLVWLLVSVLGALLFGACDGGEEDVPGDDGEELSAEEILAEAVKVAGDLHSYRMETVSEPAIGSEAMLQTLIHVGPDYYSYLHPPGKPAVSSLFEVLFYRGEVYRREGGEWVELTDGTQWLGYYPEGEDSNVGDAARNARVQAILGFELEKLVEVSLSPPAEDGLLHIHVKWRILTGAIVPPPREEAPDDPPTRGEGAIELWVDDAYHVRRRSWTIDSYSGDRLLSSQQMESTFSLFNEAELPGPLPD